MDKEEVVSKNFIEKIIDQDLAEGKYTKIATRFPPEPNGYLHIGHAKSILLNYGLAKKYNGTFNLRFDDTNPMKEKTEFVESIVSDVEWLGAKYDGDIKFASNYFDQMYEAAVLLIKKGKAYVCDLSPEQIREYRGTLTEPGKDSPYRNRSIEENLDLFERMKNGEFEDGSKVLRAKIDMASSNINMRDPIVGPQWKLLDTGETFTWISNEHCMLLVGYDEDSYYFNDPYENNGCIRYPKTVVEDRHKAQHMQAVGVVRKTVIQ